MTSPSSASARLGERTKIIRIQPPSRPPSAYRVPSPPGDGPVPSGSTPAAPPAAVSAPPQPSAAPRPTPTATIKSLGGSERYLDLLNGLYEAILIVDSGGRVVDANARSERLFKAAKGVLLGRHVGELVIGLNAEMLAEIRARLDSGRYTLIEAYCDARDGSSFVAEVAVGRIAVVSQTMACLSLRNLTSRRTTHKVQETAYHALQASPCGMAIVDMETKVAYVNPAFATIWGYGGPDAVVGCTLYDLWERDLVEQFKACLLLEAPWRGEIVVGETPDRVRHVQITAAPHRDATGRVIGIVLSFIDVTDLRVAEQGIRREAEEQLRRAREKDDFAGLINIVSLPDVVQLIDSSGKTGTLDVLDASSAVVAAASFEDGRVVSAQCSGARGREAFVAMLRRGGKAFQFRHGVVAERDPSLTESTMSLLLEGARVMDEESGAPPDGQVAAAPPAGPREETT